MDRNNVKLLIQRHRSTASDGNGADILQNSSPSVAEAIIKRDGLRAVDSGEFIIPSGVPISEGDVVKWIQDDADVTHLRSCYLFQGSLRDEGGWEADGTNTYLDNLATSVVKFHPIGDSAEISSGTQGADKFKGLLRINHATASRRTSDIPNKLMYLNKTVSGGTQTANVHDFDGDFDIFIWVTAPSSFVSGQTLFAKLGASGNVTGQRIRIYTGSSGQIQADVEDGSSNEVTLTTGSKYLTASSANLIRFRRRGSKFDLWLMNGTETPETLFNTPDATGTDNDIKSITSTRSTTIGKYEGGSSSKNFNGLIHSVRIYCGGTLKLVDARNIFKSRAQPLVMKFAGTVWKIIDNTKGKKLFATGFGKVIPETEMDTLILNSDNDDDDVPEGTSTINRTLNVYTEEPVINIAHSMFKMLNVRNTENLSGAATDYNKFSVAWADTSSEDIDEFVAEGNLLSLIKLLMIRGAGSNKYSFFVSPRGVCVFEKQGLDRGVTFSHNPYNMQISSADDTFTTNDLTLLGRIPIKTAVKVVDGFELGVDGAIDLSAEVGLSIPVAVRVYDDTANEWLKNKTVGLFNVGRETKTVQIQSYNSGSGEHDLKIHVDFEDIDISAGTPNVRQFKDNASIASIGRYKKKLFVPQFTNGADIIIFGQNLLSLSKDIKTRYTINAPFLVNFVRENHKVTIKNSLKGINVANQIIKSIHWFYPQNKTVIEVGEHEADAYDLVVGQNQMVHSMAAQTLKSMNREIPEG